MNILVVVILMCNLFIVGNAFGADDLRYFPNKKGAKWEWDCKSNKDFGVASRVKEQKKEQPAGVRHWKEYFLWEDEIKRNNEIWLKGVSMRNIPGWRPSISYARYTVDGAFILIKGSKSASKVRVTMFPLNVGKSWEYAWPSQPKFPVKVKVIAKEKLYTPRKVYDDCVVIERKWHAKLTGEDNETKEWRCAGVGLTKVIHTIGDLIIEKNLVSFSE